MCRITLYLFVRYYDDSFLFILTSTYPNGFDEVPRF